MSLLSYSGYVQIYTLLYLSDGLVVVTLISDSIFEVMIIYFLNIFRREIRLLQYLCEGVCKD